MPFLRGFYSKDLVLEYVYIINNSLLVGIIIFIRIFFTVIYSLRLVYYILKTRIIVNINNFEEEKNITNSIFILGCFVVFFGGVYY